MKLSEYAKQQGISYRTAFRWWKAGQIPGFQAATGTIIVQEPPVGGSAPQRVAVYSRGSSPENPADVDRPGAPRLGYRAGHGSQACPPCPGSDLRRDRDSTAMRQPSCRPA